MVTAVRIDGTDITVTISPTSPDTFTVSLNTLKTGIYDTVRFTLLNGTKQDYVERKLRVIKGGRPESGIRSADPQCRWKGRRHPEG